MPMSVERMDPKPTNLRMFRCRLRKLCARKYQRYIGAGMPIVMTMRALLPLRNFTGHLPSLSVLICEAGTQHLLQQRLEQRGHGAEPQRIQDDDMVGPGNEVLALPHAVHRLAFVVVRLRTQYRESQVGEPDHVHSVVARLRSFAIRRCQRMDQPVVGGIGMSVQDEDIPAHGRISLAAAGVVAARCGRRET